MKNTLLIWCVTLLTGMAAKAQRDCGLWLNEVPLVADTAANNLFATIEPRMNKTFKGTLRWDESRYSGVSLNGTALENGLQGNVDLTDWTADATNTLTITDSESRQWKLVCSTLPFVVVDCPLQTITDNYSISKDDENHYIKYPGYISIIDARCRTKRNNSDVEGMACFNSDIMIRLRGQTSGSLPKKAFSIELVKDGKSDDVHLLGYRKDDDWILAAEYSDFSRMRNRVLMDLWNSVDDLPYEKDNKYQGNGTQGEFVEVFMNGEYYGLMCFTDKIDRKKLNLKKTKEATEDTPEVTRGLLWKAIWESTETYLSGYNERPANDSFLWPYIESKKSYGWEQKYPDDTISQAFFDPLCDLMDFQKSKEFGDNWRDKFYENNVTDFILFIQAFDMLDNQKKNYYLSVRNWNKEQKYLFTIWDLDGSMGRSAGGDELDMDDPKQLAWGEKLGYHHTIHLFKDKKSRPDGYATIMNNRWQYLSTHQLSLENIRAVMEKYANLFSTSGAWEREKARWSSSYRRRVKIADTPQDEVEYMMNFLKANYALFDQEMAKDSWKHDEYEEEQYVNDQRPKALYVVSNDVTSTHEDNTVTLPGKIEQEMVAGITTISYQDSLMTVVRENEERQYSIGDIKEVRTAHTDIYSTPAFVPDSLKNCFAFDTRFTPVLPSTLNVSSSTFEVQRTIQVYFEGDEVRVSGNLEGIKVMVDSTVVALTTELEGVEIQVSGCSEKGHININSTHPCKITAAEGGAMLAGINANCYLVVNTPYALNFYNDAFDGKCLSTTGDITIENGSLYFMMTGSGTLTDADFQNNPSVGARAVLANNITIDGGMVAIKTLGHNGAVGLAAVKKITINGGNHYIATYDDPIKAGSSVTVNGGFTFATSLTNDGLDSKGDLFVNGGTISTCSPEGAEAAFDVNHFYCDGGTVIGVGYKSERPLAYKSKQAAIKLNKSKDVKKYVKITDAEGIEMAVLETPAYPTQTIVYSSPLLQKESTYTILTGDATDTLQELTTVAAE